MKFDLHTPKTAPEGSRFVLEGAQKKNGFVPNLLGVLAESPAALQAYSNLSSALQHNSAFSSAEQQVLFLAISFENRCSYCMAAHSGIASNGILTNDQIKALREGSPLAPPRLEALRSFCSSLVAKRGFLDDAEVEAFIDAGYTKRHVLDVLAAVALKTLTNYTNHLNETEVDEPFAPFTWSPPNPA